ncbi:MAG: CapA family protein [Acetatifactor sp.]|nr:CapA family protein [Acetatifactor sp.]
MIGILAAAMLAVGVLTGCGAGENRTSGTQPGVSDEYDVTESQGDSVQSAGDFGNESGSGADQTSGAMDTQETPSPEPPVTPAPEITLVMVGDILLHTPVAESARTEDGGYDFSAVFANLQEDIRAADLALVNQEVIIGGQELKVSGYPSFNAPYELGDALVEAGFDVILHATNHTLDKGKRGVVNCLNFWQENYPEKVILGIHDSAEDQEEIYVYEQGGIRVAILNYTYGTNGIALPEDMPYAVDLLKKERVINDLGRAKELADFVIVCPHWGTEYKLEEDSAQKEWAQLFADNGADLVLGTHPHVIEPVKWVDDTLVYYSLGNFVNWTSGTREGVANRMVGGMAQVTIGLDENGEAVIKDYGVKPLVCHLERGFGGVTVYPLEEYTEELAGRNEIVKQDASFSLEYCRELSEKVFGEVAEPSR